MPKYPRYSRYMDDETVKMLAWMAWALTVAEHKRISESEVIRRLIRAEYERMSGPALSDTPTA